MKKILSLLLTLSVVLQFSFIVKADDIEYVDTSNWNLTANRYFNEYNPRYVIDGDAADLKAFKWDFAKRGDWLDIDMGKSCEINSIMIETTAYTTLNHCRVYISDKPISDDIDALLAGKSHAIEYVGSTSNVTPDNTIIRLNFSKRNARYIRFVIYEDTGVWINIGEIKIMNDKTLKEPDYEYSEELLADKNIEKLMLLKSLNIITDEFLENYSENKPITLKDANDALSVIRYIDIDTYYPNKKTMGGDIILELSKFLGFDKIYKNMSKNKLCTEIGKHIGVFFAEKEFITYGKFVNIISEVIDAKRVDYSNRSGNYKIDRETYIEALGLEKIEGIMYANEYTSVTGGNPVGKDYIMIDDNVYYTASEKNKTFIGYKVTAYCSDEEVVSLIPHKKNEVNSFEGMDVYEITDTNEVYVQTEDKKSKYRLSEDYYLVVNGKSVSNKKKEYFTEGVCNTTVIDNDGDGIFEVAFVNSYRVCVAESVSIGNMLVMDKLTGETFDFSEKKEVKVIKDGKQVKLADIGVGDVLYISGEVTLNTYVPDIASSEYVTINVIREKVSGTVNRITTEDKYTVLDVDGQEIKINNEDVKRLGLSAYVVFYMGKNNFSPYFELTSKYTYGIITKIEIDDTTESVKISYVDHNGEKGCAAITEKTKMYGANVSGNKINDANIAEIRRYYKAFCDSDDINYGASEYQGASAPVIKFRLNSKNEFVIFSMPVPADGTDYPDYMLVSDTDSLQNLNKKRYTYYSRRNYQIRDGVFTDNKTKIMQVFCDWPSEGLKPAQNWKERIQVFSSIWSDSRYWRQNTFDVDMDKRTAGFILLYEEPYARRTDTYMLVEKTSTVLNDAEEITVALTGIVNGVEDTKIMVEFPDRTVQTSSYSTTAKKQLGILKPDDIKAGDLIRIDLQGSKAQAIELCYRGGALENHNQAAIGNFENEQYISGKVERVSGNLLVVNTGTLTYINQFANAKIYCYDGRQAYVASGADVVCGDNVYVYTFDENLEIILIIK